MAFTWTNISKQGGVVKVDGIQEMQDNCDYIADNIACINHKTVDHTSDYIGNLVSDYTGVLGADYTGQLVNVDTGDDSSYNYWYDVTDNYDRSNNYNSDHWGYVISFCSKISCSPQYCCMGTCTVW